VKESTKRSTLQKRLCKKIRGYFGLSGCVWKWL